MEAIYAVSDRQTDPRIASGRMVPFSFPLSKCALWDPTPVGDVIGAHISYYRNPKILMMEKALRLAYRHAKQSERKFFSCFLLGTLAMDEDCEGVSLMIDRFDPGREVTDGLGKVPTAPLPGDFVIPCSINASGSSSGDVIVHNSEDFSLAFKGLQHSLCSRDSLDLSKLLTIRVHITSTDNMDSINFDFHWAAVTITNTLEYTPVKSVPIIPTALARNLSSHMNIAQIQGTYKCGYLTMDQTRKLLLVLESDPKAYALPLVGIWLSGITHVYSPQVWACCLRYLFSSSIQERALSESGSFLIVLYSLTHKEPEFYECLPCSGQTELGFQLLTSKETLHLFKNVEPSDKHPIQFELSAEKQNEETEFFRKVSKNLSIRSPQGSSPSKLSVSDHDSGVEDEDLSPRPIPSPHPVSQQVTRIHPSVPELSLIFDGSFIEPKPMSQPVETMNNKNQPLLVHQPNKKTCSTGPLYHQNQCFDSDKKSFNTQARHSSLRRLPSQLNQIIPTLKPCRGKQPPLQQQLNCRRVGLQTRKNSESSSSSSSPSPSTPRSGPSPDTSVHQPRMLSERLVSNSDGTTHRKGEPLLRRPTTSNFKQPAGAAQPPQYNFAFSPQNSRKPTELQMPVPQVPSCYPASVCSCCQLHGHIQYSPTNAWQELVKMGPSHAENQSDVPQESTYSVFHQNVTCPNICGSPLHTPSSPVTPGYNGKMGNCSPLSSSLLPGPRLSSHASPCDPQSCAAHSACTPAPTPKMGSDNGMMGLSPEAYRILTEQDRQLKLLHAQIQRLLEAQTLPPCSTKTTTGNNALQSEKQLEFVAMETQSSQGLHMRKSVSIAVSTGASLFWNTPCEKQEDCVCPVKQDDNEMSKEDISISINTEQDTSNTSIASSLKAVDIPSFVESSHVPEEGTKAGLRNEPLSSACAPNSLLEESVSMCLQTGPTEGANNPVVTPNEAKTGQVNHFLKSSSEESDHPSTKQGMVSNDNTTCRNSNDPKERNSVSDPGLTDQDSVISATLKQLRNLGVKIESPDKMKKNAHKVENASILACINPEAVIPGLNYMSFVNVGMSGLAPTGVDLSMEANAIALKYLSESQLSQLSLSHTSEKNPEESSFQNLLHTSVDKSVVGLSLVSPNNMSFATKKYMKRYGLIQTSDNSEDEEELQTENSSSSCVSRSEDVLETNRKPVLEGFNFWKESSEGVGERLSINLKPYKESTGSYSLQQTAGPVLRNITNEIFLPKIIHQPNENSHQILKDLKPKTRLVAGKIQFTQQPETENLENVRIFPDNLQTPAPETLNQADSMSSVGTFLDVKHLRQLPKLF
ncbi:SCL-interrupting locus protein isoform X2 [Emydura macquarii macquarii]|uniref:SCL-interrupting locus protein isoform X2 n=1 Tax=Emydura macquarii macquarii TaxID=1129001 RepID=UPI00352A78A7